MKVKGFKKHQNVKITELYFPKNKGKILKMMEKYYSDKKAKAFTNKKLFRVPFSNVNYTKKKFLIW